VQRSTATDHNWWRYGPEMMSFEANTRRAIASSILVWCRHIMHITVAYDIIYHRARREADMTSASYSKKTTQHWGTSMAAPSWFEVRGVSVWCVAYLRIPIYVDNRYIAMVWPRPVAFWVEFCASEPLAWVDFFLILCNSSCNQNCTNTSILAGVFDLYIRKNSYKK
jgi:hypothetical protein